MKLPLTYPEAALLEYVIEFCYEKYSKPPFSDIEDRFSVVMDPTQDIVQAADREVARKEAREKNDLLAELGFDDDPNDSEYVAQYKKAEFYASRALLRRWYNAFQFSLYCRARFDADEEKTMADYWARHDHPRLLILYASIEKDATRTLYLEHDAVEDLRALVHYLCDFAQKSSPQLLRTRESERLKRLAGTEEPVNEDQLAVYFQQAEALNNLFQGALRPLIEKLLGAYRDSKFRSAL